jgi:LPXTG-motif cell wall-anchored protein
MLMSTDNIPISFGNGAIGKEVLLKIVYAGIGVFIVANAIPRLTQLNIMLTIQRDTGINTNTWVSFVGMGMQLLIGTLLFLKQKKKS